MPQVTAPVPILMVDDRAQELLVLQSILANPEYELVSARSGEEALKLLLDRDFALVLLDLMMPGMDGFEVASFIRRRPRSKLTPIVFLTAAGTEVTAIHRAYAVGGVDYLAKPIDAEIVKAKVAIFVELFRKDRQLLLQSEALRESDKRERALQMAEMKLAHDKRYRDLAEAIPQMVWTARPDGAWDYCNRRWCDYTGFDFEHTRDWRWLDAVHAEDRENLRTRWRESVAGTRPFEVEARLRRGADGVFRWHLARAVPETDDAGGVVAWLGTCADVEDFKGAIRVRDDFLAVAAHELRTPLTALRLRLEGIRRRQAKSNGGTDSPVAEKIEDGIRQVARLGRLVDALLDVSRIEAGHLKLDREEFDLAEAVRDVVDRLHESAELAGCAVELRATTAPGHWDRLRIEEVMANLLLNAIKYGAGKPVSVRVSVDDETRTARLEVQDFGIGIAPEHLHRIFQRFERAAPTEHYGGFGIGLYITRQIVEAHGGSIGVATAPGAGSTFTVRLPTRVENSRTSPRQDPA
jgi:PAS domain S-box-containing protein